MKKVLLIFIAALLIFSSSCKQSSSTDANSKEEVKTEQEGEKSPAIDFELDKLSGEKVKLSDLKGKYVVLNFFTVDCPYCVREMPYFIKASEDYKDKGIEILFIDSGNSPKDVKSFVEESKLNIDPALDTNGEVFYKYSLRGVPTTIFIDKDGNITDTHVGLMKEEDLKAALDKFKS